MAKLGDAWFADVLWKVWNKIIGIWIFSVWQTGDSRSNQWDGLAYLKKQEQHQNHGPSYIESWRKLSWHTKWGKLTL